MMSTLPLKEAKVLDVQFVGDENVLNHIFDREAGTKLKKEKAQLLVNPQKIIKKSECELEKSDQEVLKDQNYVEVLGRSIQDPLKKAVGGGNKVYSFQHRKHSEEMAKLALELAKTPRKVVPLDSKAAPEIMKNVTQKSKGHSTSEKVQLERNNNKTESLSTPTRCLRKRIIVSTFHCDSESEYSASDSEDDREVGRDDEDDTDVAGLSQKSRAPVSQGTPLKKVKRDKAVSEGALEPKENSEKCLPGRLPEADRSTTEISPLFFSFLYCLYT